MYNKFSEYLKEKYNKKVYKLPINIPSNCPNRDGKIGFGGCIFCGEEGTGFENLSNKLSIGQQLNENKERLKKRYKPEKYIAYFQNYTNTYFPIDIFKKYIIESCVKDVVAIYISTRPDCITKEQLEFLNDINCEKNIDIVLEIGLQTVNYKTLKILKRGHTLAEFIEAIFMIKEYNINTCVHYILDIPFDSIDDVIEGAKIISALKIDQVKCHSLYILENTEIAIMYKNKEFKLLSLEDYINRAISFLEYLNPDIVVQRLVSRAPKERTIFCNWNMSWWKVHDKLIEEMNSINSYQGKRYKP
ncbi:MAG: TIGR01212 family radical SAM protein [Clostridiales bacterium]